MIATGSLRAASLAVFLFLAGLLFYFRLSATFFPPQHRPSVGTPVKSPRPAISSRSNVWGGLSNAEAVSVLDWIHGKSRGLNLTAVGDATTTDNVVWIIDLLQPNKTDAIAFLDGVARIPERFARVTIRRNTQEDRFFDNYMVGPLPISSHTALRPLSYGYNSGRSSTSTKSYGSDINALQAWLEEISAQAQDITSDLFRSMGGNFENAEPKFEVSSTDQVFEENGRTMRWIMFSQTSDAPTLLPQGLYFKADTTGRDPKEWRVVQWLYNDKVYDNIDQLRQAWLSPEFEKLYGNLDGNWTAIEPEIDFRYTSNQPPYLHQGGESRILVDKNNSFVSWMGFNFNLAFSQVSGVSIFDIRLDGERIIYELSLQEALAHYAGNDPIQSSTAFLDSFYGLGSGLSELVPGYDCPAYAHFLDTEYHRSEMTYTRTGTICVFEAPSEHPLQRHARGSKTSSFLNSVMIVRSIAVVGNYDYSIDYIFYLDGSIEVKARASGYIQGGYYVNNQKYGYHVHDFLSSSIHDHVINFKVDFDIAGPRNTMSILTVVPKDIEYPWSPELRRTMVLERSQISNEDEAAINWPPNAASMYVITNSEAKNQFGETRGYRIMPGTGMGSPVHLTMTNSSILKNAAKWAEHDFFVTKQKDTEPRSAAAENYLAPEDPLIRFDRFLDGENLVNEDIVVWFNLGTHHVPHSGDIPNTLMTTSASSVMFSPHNYHTRDRSRSVTNGVQIDVSQSPPKLSFYGVGERREDVIEALHKFKGKPAPIRKYPALEPGQ